ncbi:MAG: ATP synthase F0 subunit C [Alphaproteobacteria bacterium]|nr:ATP synthase F0 subunit C [Alphaproteobacteria bacterium]
MPLLVALAVLLTSQAAYAQEAAATPGGYWGIGAGLAMGLAALGGTYGQGNAARGFYESVSRNPQAADKIQTSFFVGLAFIESLVIFAFAIAFLLQQGR